MFHGTKEHAEQNRNTTMNVRNTPHQPHNQQERPEHVPSTKLPPENTQPAAEPIRARLSQPVHGWKTTEITIDRRRNGNGHRRVAIRAHMTNGLYIALELQDRHAFNLADRIVDAMEGGAA